MMDWGAWQRPNILDLIWYFLFGKFFGSQMTPDEYFDWLEMRKQKRKGLDSVQTDWKEGDQFK